MLLTLPGESKRLLVVLTNRDWEQSIFQISRCISGTGDALVCSHNKVTARAAAAVEITIWRNLQ